MSEADQTAKQVASATGFAGVRIPYGVPRKVPISREIGTFSFFMGGFDFDGLIIRTNHSINLSDQGLDTRGKRVYATMSAGE